MVGYPLLGPGLEDYGVGGVEALPTEHVALEVLEALLNRHHVPPAKPLAAPGALGALGPGDGARVDVFAGELPAAVVGTLTGLVPEVRDIAMLSGTRRHVPTPAGDVLDLVASLLEEPDAASFAGVGWCWWCGRLGFSHWRSLSFGQAFGEFACRRSPEAVFMSKGIVPQWHFPVYGIYGIFIKKLCIP